MDCGEMCLFLGLLRDVSVPLASEIPGEPKRFFVERDATFLRGSVYFVRPEGVFVPLVEVPEFLSDSLPFSLRFRSSSALRCSSLRRSVSVSSVL